MTAAANLTAAERDVVRRAGAFACVYLDDVPARTSAHELGLIAPVGAGAWALTAAGVRLWIGMRDVE